MVRQDSWNKISVSPFNDVQARGFTLVDSDHRAVALALPDRTGLVAGRTGRGSDHSLAVDAEPFDLGCRIEVGPGRRLDLDTLVVDRTGPDYRTAVLDHTGLDCRIAVPDRTVALGNLDYGRGGGCRKSRLTL